MNYNKRNEIKCTKNLSIYRTCGAHNLDLLLLPIFKNSANLVIVSPFFVNIIIQLNEGCYFYGSYYDRIQTTDAAQ